VQFGLDHAHRHVLLSVRATLWRPAAGCNVDPRRRHRQGFGGDGVAAADLTAADVVLG
jgi:hypothetical protein